MIGPLSPGRVPGPSQPVFRIASWRRDAFEPRPYAITGTGRFDCPPGQGDLGYSVVYAATQLAGALAEILQHDRPALAMVARAGVESLLPFDLAAWCERFSVSTARVEANGQFVDVSHPDTLSRLRRTPELARIALDCGLADIDLSAVTSRQRPFTQAISLAIHQAEPEVAGIRYQSRFGTDQDHDCWAIFADRAEFKVTSDRLPIPPDDPDLRTVLQRFGIEPA